MHRLNSRPQSHSHSYTGRGHQNNKKHTSITHVLKRIVLRPPEIMKGQLSSVLLSAVGVLTSQLFLTKTLPCQQGKNRVYIYRILSHSLL